MSKLFTAFSERLRDSRRGLADAADVPTRAPASTAGGTASRKQLLAVVLRETLLRNNVPAAWLGMEFFRTMDRAGGRTDGIHVRLVVRDPHPDLPARMLVLERDFRRRVALIDYRATEWLQGVTWQFDLPEDVQVPEAQPSETPELPLRPGAARQPQSHGCTYAFTEPAPL